MRTGARSGFSFWGVVARAEDTASFFEGSGGGGVGLGFKEGGLLFGGCFGGCDALGLQGAAFRCIGGGFWRVDRGPRAVSLVAKARMGWCITASRSDHRDADSMLMCSKGRQYQ